MTSSHRWGWKLIIDRVNSKRNPLGGKKGRKISPWASVLLKLYKQLYVVILSASRLMHVSLLKSFLLPLVSSLPPDLNNNNSLHLPSMCSRCCDAQRVSTRLSPALNSSVFTGDPLDPDKQTSAFEYQQHVSMATGRQCCYGGGSLMMHGSLGKKARDHFNTLSKHVL